MVAPTPDERVIRGILVMMACQGLAFMVGQSNQLVAHPLFLIAVELVSVAGFLLGYYAGARVPGHGNAARITVSIITSWVSMILTVAVGIAVGLLGHLLFWVALGLAGAGGFILGQRVLARGFGR